MRIERLGLDPSLRGNGNSAKWKGSQVIPEENDIGFGVDGQHQPVPTNPGWNDGCVESTQGHC